jgi:nicotinate-nucleotide pyrophosphorylase (carboxylating)
MDWQRYDRLIQAALQEDCAGDDVTTTSLVAPEARETARMLARDPGVPAGLGLAARVAQVFDEGIEFCEKVPDGTGVEPGTVLATLEGPAAAILSVERTMLNFVQRLSGIATLTARYVEEVRGTGTGIYDTRKTTPGWRELEKYAVRCGGGCNHRMTLSEMALIKDNHLAIFGASPDEPQGVGRAVETVRRVYPDVPVEVEVDTLEQLEAALPGKPDLVLLDNMSPADVRRAVVLVDQLCSDAHRPKLEASGGITLANVREYAHAGADRIAIGAITHSAPAMDIGLDMELST